ncbi:MAG: hypothetical protein DRI90_06140 [Deltaproteobacteria bacterium]|nr:MAG: hypothetical protein DRI90_06140 [Deltaproteobacteria bacterium]
MGNRSVSYLIGADENGLGPRLGPMIVTATLARVAAGAERLVTSAARGALAERLGDSKDLVAHGNITLAEAWSRVLVARGAGGHRQAGTPADLLDALSLDDAARLREPCPAHVEAQCWSTDRETFPDQLDDLRGLVNNDLDQLASQGVEIVAVRSVVVCTRLLNRAAKRGESRFAVDLHAMERLVIALRDLCDQPIEAVCGKVGGYGQYGKVFGPLGGRLHTVLEEGRARSAYHFPEVGEVAFVRNADASNLLVGLSSLVGKYLRELLMDRIVDHYRRQDPKLPAASGYHDPVTARFVSGTEGQRQRQRIPSTCFERQRAQQRPAKR